MGLRGGCGSESEYTKALWSALGMVPMDCDEMTGEASGESESCNSYSSDNEETGAGNTQMGWWGEEMYQQTESESQFFSTDVSDTRRQHKRRKFRKSGNPGHGRYLLRKRQGARAPAMH